MRNETVLPSFYELSMVKECRVARILQSTKEICVRSCDVCMVQFSIEKYLIDHIRFIFEFAFCAQIKWRIDTHTHSQWSKYIVTNAAYINRGITRCAPQREVVKRNTVCIYDNNKSLRINSSDTLLPFRFNRFMYGRLPWNRVRTIPIESNRIDKNYSHVIDSGNSNSVDGSNDGTMLVLVMMMLMIMVVVASR